MKISKVVERLEHIKKEYGDIEVQIQNWPKPEDLIVSYETFFIVPEDYPEYGWTVNIRAWPY